MKTEVIMKRELFGCEISQKSKSEFFSATDLVKAGNRWRAINGLSSFDVTVFFKRKDVKEFIGTLEEKYGTVKISGRGRGKHTWVHPLLFIDIALAISPKLKIEVYEWLFDHLIKNRNDSGDSFKKMAGELYGNSRKKSIFPREIQKVGMLIKKACSVTDWQKATEYQLKKRDTLHESIALLASVLKDNEQAVRIAIDKNKENQND